MSIFDGRRLPPEAFDLDVEGIRQGIYTDKYFVNIARLLQTLSQIGYTHQGKHARLDPTDVPVGDMRAEMQVFTRRPGKTVVAGVDAALAVLQVGTGYWDEDRFVSTPAWMPPWPCFKWAPVTGTRTASFPPGRICRSGPCRTGTW